ncbi:unnamed protein product [Spirodela intermedia]|uniref:Uncharacterized protein n=1 Tax=Spirodela intermedia TaxID=51605 RepID=A0A7I8IWK3_SPIIN|nr:unnamed protein product [Spirodela intermedia]CAA6662151.1 unnamed protein product [Spirodela intermedia]
MGTTSRLLLRRSSRMLANRDGGLLSALRSELEHELSSNPPRSGSVSRRRFGSGEEIALSALLGPLIYEGKDPLPRHALMKVFVKKPEPEPILQFDCTVFHQDQEEDSEFVIENVKYLASADPSRSSRYRGPSFSCLDPDLQDAFKDYLVDRGVNAELTNFLLLHLRQKEQDQYLNWLHGLENFLKSGV